MTTDYIVEVGETAGTATCRSHFTVPQEVPALAPRETVAWRHHDRVVREDAEWRLAGRRFRMDLVGELSRHLMTELHDRT